MEERSDWEVVAEALGVAAGVGLGRACSCKSQVLRWPRGLCLHCLVAEAEKALSRLLMQSLVREVDPDAPAPRWVREAGTPGEGRAGSGLVEEVVQSGAVNALPIAALRWIQGEGYRWRTGEGER